jgi:hypothetical protein
LLIKHRDDWSGDVDITEFAPKSVKSGGDFEDILAQDTPAVWTSNRPAKGGEAGALLAAIIDKAARLKRQSAAAKAAKTTTAGAAKTGTTRKAHAASAPKNTKNTKKKKGGR